MKLNISFSVHRNEVPEDESVDAGDGKHDGPGGEVAQVNLGDGRHFSLQHLG